jgi:hypothetical protein
MFYNASGSPFLAAFSISAISSICFCYLLYAAVIVVAKADSPAGTPVPNPPISDGLVAPKDVER